MFADASAMANYLQNLLDGPPPSQDQLQSIAQNLPPDSSPDDIKNNLRLLALLNGNNTTPLTVETAEFTFIAQPLKENEPVQLTTSGADLGLPPGLGGSSASIIQWATNPYNTTQQLDTPVLSIEVADAKGGAVKVQNLTTPIRFVWQIPPSVDRQPYNITYKCLNETTAELQNGTQIIAEEIQCNKTRESANITCITAEQDTWLTALCPAPQLEGGCLYYNEATSNWTSDGCKAVYVDADILICECTHLTDFGARISSVLDTNANVFKSFSSIYTLETFLRLWSLYVFFGAWFLTAITSLIILHYMDKKAARNYLKHLASCSEIREMQRFLPEDALLDRCQAPYKANPDEGWQAQTVHVLPKPPQGFWNRLRFTLRIWMERLVYQHSYLSVFFRFDPRLPRVFRATFIFVTIFHTLFITTLLYGFSHGAASGAEALPEMSTAESVVLSIISSALNVIFIKFFFILMNSAGSAEFKWRYPYLYEELLRRHKIEEALCTIPTEQLVGEIQRLRKKTRRASTDIYADFSEQLSADTTQNISDDEDIAAANDSAIAMESNDVIEYLLIIVRCRKKPRVIRNYTLRTAKGLLKLKIPGARTQVAKWVAAAPVHTVRGWIALGIPIAWLIWCMQYLLAFAASQTQDTANKLFESYGISQLTTIFVMQPLTLFATMAITVLLFYIVNKISPGRCSKAQTGVKALEFFSDPLASKGSTSLSASFAYWIFLRAPSDVSIRTPWNTNMDIACATPKAAIGYLESNMSAQDNTHATTSCVSEQRTVAIYALWRGLIA